MYLRNFAIRRIAPSLVALGFTCLVETIDAQRPSPERKPDVSGKALITKQTPEPKKKAPAPGAVKQYSIEQFMATTRLTGASFSSDEKSILFSSNKSGI